MRDNVKNGNPVTPILIPYEPAEFWEHIRQIVQDEVAKIEMKVPASPVVYETPGMTYKPLYKINELCSLFQVSKPTIYDWVKHGKLKPFKIRSRVFFLWQDVQQLLHA